MKNTKLVYKTNLLLPLALLSACSNKKPIVGERESIVVSSVDERRKFDFDESPVIIDTEQKNSNFMQNYMNSSHSYRPLNFAGSFQKVWSAQLKRGAGDSLKITASPVVADGRVFCMDADGRVYANAQKTGARLWEVSTTLPKKDGQLGGAMAYHRGRLIVTSSFSECFSIDPTDGKILWRINLPAPCKGDGITVADGKAYILCSNSKLQVLDVTTGKLIWSHSGIVAESSFIGSAAVAVSDGLVFVAYPSGEIHALLQETGESIWDTIFSKASLIDTAHSFIHPRACPVVKDGIVYFSSASCKTYALDIKTGNTVWEREFGSVQTPIVSGNSIFIFKGSSEIVCLNNKTGALRWASVLDNSAKMAKATSGDWFSKTLGKLLSKNNHNIGDWYGQLLVSGHILMLSPNGRAMLLSASDGKIVKSAMLKTGGTISVNPVVASSTMYVLDDGGTLSAYQ